MKNVSLWAMVLSSALFVVVVCIDQQRWDWLGYYGILAVVWCLIGWLWQHKGDLKHDFNVLINCESPFKCRLFWSPIIYGVVFIAIAVLLIGGIIFGVTQLIKVF